MSRSEELEEWAKAQKRVTNKHMCRVCKYIRKHFKNFIIKTLCVLNAFSLFYWMYWIDAIISWQPWVIMLVNASYANVFRTDEN